MNIDKLIEDFNGAASQKEDIFGGRVFSDEPLLFKASQMQNRSEEPPEYDAMRRLAYGKSRDMYTEAQVFYEQARLMENFTDDCPFNQPFSRFFISYRQLTPKQLRGYFTFRTKIRQGEYPEAPEPYVFLLLSELFMCIGERDADSAFDRIRDVIFHYEMYYPKLKSYRPGWYRDFAVYYNLPPADAIPKEAFRFDEALAVFTDCRNKPDEALFDAVCLLSGVNETKMELYRKNPGECKAVLCHCIRALSRYYDEKRKLGLVQSLFGTISEFPVSLFSSVVFYDVKQYKSYTYSITPIYRYTCHNGSWRLYRSLSNTRANPQFGGMVQDILCLADEVISGASPKPMMCLSSPLQRAIRKALEEYRVQKKEREARTVTIDLTLLDSIRRLSDITQDKLLTSEETQEQDSGFRGQDSGFSGQESGNGEKDAEKGIFTKEERSFLLHLLNGRAKEAVVGVKMLGIPLSVFCDGLNEKLYEEFADTVIICETDEPYIFEDYSEDLKGMLEQ